MKKTTLVTLAAAILSAKMAGAVGYRADEIERLEVLVEREDIGAIRAFAQEFAGLADDDPLSEFIKTVERDSAVVDGQNTRLAWNVRHAPGRFGANLRRGGLVSRWHPPRHVIRSLYGKKNRIY